MGIYSRMVAVKLARWIKVSQGAPQASSPFASTTNFGASSSPASLGASSLFGSSGFGQKALGFSTPRSNPFGSTWQHSQPAFGNSSIGSSTLFGPTSTPLFGASTTPASGATRTSAVGASNQPFFGVTSTSAFGTSPTRAFRSIGTTFGNTGFGSGGTFGASGTLASGSRGAFGFADVAEAVAPYVVHLKFVDAGCLWNGTGVLINEHTVITCAHNLVNKAKSNKKTKRVVSQLQVILSTGRKVKGVVVDRFVDDDIATVKINSGVPVKSLKLAYNVRQGDLICAIGYSADFQNSLTAGVVRDHEVAPCPNRGRRFFQIDCPINHGNSGGPIFNMKAELVGMLTSSYSGTLCEGIAIQGVSFVIPILRVWRVIGEQLESEL